MAEYRQYLLNELQSRKSLNSSYSMRSFANFLGLTPSSLSMILNGKRGLSLKTAEKLADRMQLLEHDKKIFTLSTQLERTKETEEKKLLSKKIEGIKSVAHFKELMPDSFKIISEWYHFAILELIETRDFCNNSLWIANQLNISEVEVKAALLRLKQNGMIIIEKGKIFSTGKSFTTTIDVPSQVIRKVNKEILDKAKDSLDQQSVNEREFSILTVGIDKERLPEFKEMLTRFRRELNDFSESIPKSKRNSVYIYSSGFFEATKSRV